MSGFAEESTIINRNYFHCIWNGALFHVISLVLYEAPRVHSRIHYFLFA